MHLRVNANHIKVGEVCAFLHKVGSDNESGSALLQGALFSV